MSARSVAQQRKTALPTFPTLGGGILQRKCACGQHSAGGECESCRKSREGALQRAATTNASPMNEVPPIVHEVLRSPGQPLDPTTRAFMEPRFGHDFSQVRVHTDTRAAESARAVNALAYTMGRDVVFGAGQYAPRTGEGQGLLAHELTHTIQQGSGTQPSTAKLEITNPNDVAEQQAEMAVKAIVEGKSFAPPSRETVHLARQADAATHARAVSSETPQVAQDAGSCTPSIPGIPPTFSDCSAYLANSWWLPMAYVTNATCACLTTPNSQTANCVRKFLQDRLAASPGWLKTLAASQKPNDNPVLPTYPVYQAFVQTFLTPRIYQDHVDAYANCCCPSGPAPYPSWVGVTTVPVPVCDLVGLTIRYFGSCHGTPGSW